MDGLYNDIRIFTSERKAAKSRGDSLSGKVTATMRDKLENFLNKEAENMLHKVTGALETGFSTILDGTLGTAVSKSGESRVSKAVSALHQSYTQAFTNIQRTGRACKDDIAVLKAISREATNESSLVHSLAEQVQTTVPRVKREADADLASDSKRLNVKGTDRQPIEID